MGIKQPPDYVYPKKRKQQAAEPEPQITAPVEPVRPPIKKKREKRSDTNIASDQSVQLRLVIPSPAAGQLRLHDEMIAAGYTSKQTLLGLLKKGFVRSVRRPLRPGIRSTHRRCDYPLGQKGSVMAEKDALVINQTDLIAKLEEAKGQSDGDLARVIELLLLENHVLSRDQSTGFRRGIEMDFSDFPRFLKIDDAEEPTSEEEG